MFNFKFKCKKSAATHHRQVFVGTIKVFQLAKTCSEIISCDIFRPDTCGVMFVCCRMDSGHEHVRRGEERLETERKSSQVRLSQYSFIQMPKGSLSKARQQRQMNRQRRHQGKGIKTMAVHVRYKFLYISQPFSAKQPYVK